MSTRRTPTAQSLRRGPPISFIGFEFVVGSGPNPTLIVRDAQHEYVFAAAVATK
jgi:hypothetical protein